MYDRKFIFSIEIDREELNQGIENQPFPVCSSLHLFIFPSLHAFSIVTSFADFLATLQGLEGSYLV